MALADLANGAIDHVSFKAQSAMERESRVKQAVHLAEIAIAAENAAREADALKAKSQAFFADPAYRRRLETKDLRRRFGIGYIEQADYGKVLRLLKQLAARQQLDPSDAVWLQSRGYDYWTDAVARAWHELEAEALEILWHRSGDAWQAVNASAHWRKADLPDKAIKISLEALANERLNPKLESALHTTYGGALRDVRRLSDAKSEGQKAMALTPNDFRPYTLLGAVSMEEGDLDAGRRYYQRAEELGASRHAIDHDLRTLLGRVSLDERTRICAYLLAEDAARFAWLRKLLPRHKRAG
jgi:tetratricopeptide (TPR) repeat protein